MKGAIAKAQELAEEIGNVWIPQQFDNRANPEIHRKTTYQEILNDFSEGLDYLITGVGTGGHITGISEVVKEKISIKNFLLWNLNCLLSLVEEHSSTSYSRDWCWIYSICSQYRSFRWNCSGK